MDLPRPRPHDRHGPTRLRPVLLPSTTAHNNAPQCRLCFELSSWLRYGTQRGRTGVVVLNCSSGRLSIMRCSRRRLIVASSSSTGRRCNVWLGALVCARQVLVGQVRQRRVLWDQEARCATAVRHGTDCCRCHRHSSCIAGAVAVISLANRVTTFAR